MACVQSGQKRKKSLTAPLNPNKVRSAGRNKSGDAIKAVRMRNKRGSHRIKGPHEPY